eukprot:scaffold61605_cov36-Phaeocystis_antarctica.AAC.2
MSREPNSTPIVCDELPWKARSMNWCSRHDLPVPEVSEVVKSATLGSSAIAGSLRRPRGGIAPLGARGQPWASGWASGVVRGRVHR